MNNFQPLDGVDRGSKTEHQVVENLNKFVATVRTDFNFMTNSPLNIHYNINRSHIHLMRSSISFK